MTDAEKEAMLNLNPMNTTEGARYVAWIFENILTNYFKFLKIFFSKFVI
jgi:hypothetical protein